MLILFNKSKVIFSKKFNLLLINHKRKYVISNNNNIIEKIAGAYQPQQVETKESIEFLTSTINCDLNKNDKPTFTMLLPPPNVTGKLHLGHALMCTIQDVIVRWKRKIGYNPIWIPGTDHAGIATQVIVEKRLHKEQNLTRHDIGRERFLQEIVKWKNTQQNEILHDLRCMGASLDWPREYFTMDEQQSTAVTTAFIELFNKGYIYRKESLINWSCTLESAISDIEVDNREINGPTALNIPGYEKPIVFGELYNFAYKIMDNNQRITTDKIIVSTTRPETILGDVAVAVHPLDTRYNHLKNIQLWHPIRLEPIPLIFDDTVDREFGTGAVKITPAHDKFDFELAEKHKLPILPVFNEQGLIVIDKRYNSYCGLRRFDAREKIKYDLLEKNLFIAAMPHKMILPVCSRSNDIIEYLLKPQWFMKCKELAEVAIAAVESGSIQLQPLVFVNEWKRWLSNCHDWCISRQLWWGHRIPIYKCYPNKNDSKSFKWIAAKSLDECRKLLASEQFNGLTTTVDNISIEQDTDVLDTWFSSAILPISVFGGWPTAQPQQPLDLMETGHDILFFWVARMVMLTHSLTGTIPFKNVLLHGIVCDGHGRKMSKSLGNAITPKQVIYGVTLKELNDDLQKLYNTGVLSVEEWQRSIDCQRKLYPNGISECGTDALRFTFCGSNIKNHFINFDIGECLSNKLFFNKIWQATRYTLAAHQTQQINVEWSPRIDEIELAAHQMALTKMDQWILSRLANTILIINRSMDEYNFHITTNAIRTFFYTNFCDVYLETTKPEIAIKHSIAAKWHCTILKLCLSIGLEKMSAITPFLSRELLKYLPTITDFNSAEWINPELEQEIEQIIEICSAVRQLKSQNNISWKYQPKVHLLVNNQEHLNLLQEYSKNIKTLTQSTDIQFYEQLDQFNSNTFIGKSSAGHLCTFGITANQLYDEQQQQQRRQHRQHGQQDQSTTAGINNKKLIKLQNELLKIETIISNVGYKKSANENIQKRHLEKISQLKIEIDSIKGIL